MKLELSWLVDKDTPANEQIAEIYRFLSKNLVNPIIKCLDEKWEVVEHYTDHITLEIDDSTPPEKIERIKKFTSKLFETMRTTEAQLESAFKDEETNKETAMTEKLPNILKWLTKKEEAELFYMLKRKMEKPFKELLDGLDEDTAVTGY